MKSLHSFIVSPYKERYNNKVAIGEKELIVNTNIEKHIFINSQK